MSNWIKYSERIPDKNCYCWVIFDDGDMILVEYKNGFGYIKGVSLNYICNNSKPKYWNEINKPEPPED